ncbi:hypothetical protein GCM10010449_07060 [Streptomyces rectiviolaceus]|uniref:Uncharacterized protein n=1 Tax=Streptomyces rectiviolaceus TaxID=332591 RepID=A0ABP6M9T4_9ACTN
MVGTNYAMISDGQDRNPESYSASDLRKTEWGTFERQDSGSWKTVWRLTLRNSRSEGQVDVFRDDAIGFVSTIHFTGSPSAQLLVITREHAMSPEYYPATYTSFRIINDELSEIDKIQDLPRDWYAPFRGR